MLRGDGRVAGFGTICFMYVWGSFQFLVLVVSFQRRGGSRDCQNQDLQDYRIYRIRGRDSEIDPTKEEDGREERVIHC